MKISSVSSISFLFFFLMAFAPFPAAGQSGTVLDKFKSEADRDEFYYDDSGDVPWKEQVLDIPPAPADEDLIQVQVDHPPIGFKVYVDRNTVSIGDKDAVVRYWMVLKAGKSRNAMYEGMRCDTHQYKTYAYENKWKKGKLNRVKSAKWQSLKADKHNAFRQEMRQDFFCDIKHPRKINDIRASLAGSHSERNVYDELLFQ